MSGRLLEAGVEIHEHRAALLHAKTMRIEGRWSPIGCTNLDNRSFADDLLHSKKLKYAEWRHRGVQERLLEIFTLPLHDLL